MAMLGGAALVRAATGEVSDDQSLGGVEMHASTTGLIEYLAEDDAHGIDIARDDLTFYSLIYWPIDADSEVPPADVMARVDAFMRNGGTVLFDTRDGIEAIGVSTGFGGGVPAIRIGSIAAWLGRRL